MTEDHRHQTQVGCEAGQIQDHVFATNGLKVICGANAILAAIEDERKTTIFRTIIFAAIGVNMNQYRSSAQLNSRVGICLEKNESAGNHKSGKITKGNRWLWKTIGEVFCASIPNKNKYLSAQ